VKKLLIVLFAFLPVTAFAEYNFNNVSLEYSTIDLDIDGTAIDGPGYGASFSKTFKEDWLFGLGVSRASLEHKDTDLEISEASVHVGKLFEVGKGKAAVSIGAFDSSFDYKVASAGVADSDDDGQFLSGAYIFPVSDTFDLIGDITRSKGGSDYDTVWGVTASYDASEKAAVYLAYDNMDDGDDDGKAISLGLRVNL
jgi:hypothetical protein